MKKTGQIDLMKLALYVLKRIWLVILCAAIGFAGMYWQASRRAVDTYTASGTMYMVNGNPNLVNYQYATTGDLYAAAQLIETYSVVVKSESVMGKVAERLLKTNPDYQALPLSYLAGTISMSSVQDTGVVRISVTTTDAQRSLDICRAVMEEAPAAIKSVVHVGDIEIVDSPNLPTAPNPQNIRRRALTGALAGGVLAAAVLALLFLLNRKITDVKDLTDSYEPPVLASIKRKKKEVEGADAFLLSDKSPMEAFESYAKLRMNLLYTLVGKPNNVVIVTSAIAGEGKSTITSNLAISVAMSGKKVMLIDADMRRACQRDIFRYSRKLPGLSNVLAGNCSWRDSIVVSKRGDMDIMPAGQLPPNPAELLDSPQMKQLLKELSQHYDLILLDAPPINIVSDPLVLSSEVAGCLFVVRQFFSDHREISHALRSAEMTGMNVLGFVFYGEKLSQSSYYSRKYYHGYYHKYDTRARVKGEETETKDTNQDKVSEEEG